MDDLIPRRVSPLTRRTFLARAGAAGAGTLGLALLGGVAVAAEPRHAAHEMAGNSRADREALQDAMRKLWEDHIIWTRMVIVSFAAGLPDLDVAIGRLLRNQDEIGAAIVPFFGAAAGDALAALLREHISGAAALLAAVRGGDADAIEAARVAWYANGDAIAAFLHGANPRDWPLGEMTAMMREHLDLTLEEAAARLEGDWEGDVAAYDRVHAAILRMADMLTAGLLGARRQG
jgi:hypothetical protein